MRPHPAMHAFTTLLAGGGVLGVLVGLWSSAYAGAAVPRAIPHAVCLGLGLFLLPAAAGAWKPRVGGAVTWGLQLGGLAFLARRAALDGDGIQRHEHYDLVVAGSWVVLVVAAATGALAIAGAPRWRHGTGLAGVAVALAASRLPPAYSDLAFFAMATGAALVSIWVADHAPLRSRIALAGFGALAPAFLLFGELDFARALNTASLPGVSTPAIFGDPARARAPTSQPDDQRVGPPEGQTVVLIVLESVRWDRWADPAVAPGFARWRRHGTYFPNAISQYPATPLAYGAIFVGQPPNVLVRTTSWTRHRPLDVARPMFDAIHLSRPDEEWFADDAIVGFISEAPRVATHASSEAALAALRAFLEAHPRQRTFSWVHLYEPHQPWQSRPPFQAGEPSPVSAYESEVRYVDHHLAAFFDWFYRQPEHRDALVIVVGDHGEGLGEVVDGRPFVGHHVNVTTGVAWVPLYVSGPRIPTATVGDGTLVAQLDVMPTVFDYLGLRMPAALHAQGRPIQAQLRDPRVRPLPTEAFAVRGRALFEAVRRARTETVSRAELQEVISLGRYPAKLGLQVGEVRLVMNRNTREIRAFHTGTHIEAPSEVPGADERRRVIEAWEAEQSWVVEQLRVAGEDGPPR